MFAQGRQAVGLAMASLLGMHKGTQLWVLQHPRKGTNQRELSRDRQH